MSKKKIKKLKAKIENLKRSSFEMEKEIASLKEIIHRNKIYYAVEASTPLKSFSSPKEALEWALQLN